MHYAATFTCVLLLAIPMVVRTSAGTVVFPDDIPNLQAAIDSSAPGDTVLVQPGEWHFQTVYLRSGVSIYSMTGDPTTTSLRGRLRAYDVSEVVLSGLILGNGGVSCISAEVLMGDVVLSSTSGKALRCESSTVTLRHVNVSGNDMGIWAEDSQLLLEDVRFLWNGRASSGAGMYCTSSDVTMSNCLFAHNEVGWFDYTHTWWEYGGQGGGACLENGSTLMARDVVFDSNHTWQTGGGLALIGSSTYADLTGCGFINNTTSDDVSSGGQLQRGAGLYVEGAAVMLRYSWFFGNSTAGQGGGICGGLELTNCTFVDNCAGAGSAVYGDSWRETTISNSILCCTPGGVGGSGVSLSRCCMWSSVPSGEETGRPSLDADPLFCDYQTQDFTLCADSPCLPSNNEWGDLIGAFWQGCGPCGTVVEDLSWGSLKAMYRSRD